MLKTIPQYLSAMSDTFGLTRTLGVIDVCTDSNGKPLFLVGNNSIIFRIRHKEREMALKCYTRDKRNLRRIYGAKCLREELYIHSDESHGEWVDVILDDWVEGRTLQRAIAESVGNTEQMRALAEEFDRLALSLLGEEWAHGDLKPENIIVTPDGRLQLIDFDAMFRPEFAGERSDETGTTAFQHPARTADYFDKSIDDYPIALISTALHALALDPTLAERYDMDESLLMRPKDIFEGRNTALDEILSLLARSGEAASYRIAQLLRSVTPKLHGLQTLLTFVVAQRSDATDAATDEVEPPMLDNLNGLWGYRRGEKFVIPPIYDCGFEFQEGLAAVCFGGCWHYIRTDGSTALRCPHFEAVKSFRNGEAVVIENGVRKRINRNGEVL